MGGWMGRWGDGWWKLRSFHHLEHDEPEISRSLISAILSSLLAWRKDLTREWKNLECCDGVIWLDMYCRSLWTKNGAGGGIEKIAIKNPHHPR